MTQTLRSSLSPYIVGTLLIFGSFGLSKLTPTQSLFLSSSAATLEASEQEEKEGVSTLGWELLQSYEQGQKLSAELQAFLGQRVRIPGFAVPLNPQNGGASEFLFVPNQLACIHIPPPPPHLMFYVDLEKPIDLDDATGALWLEGLFKYEEVESEYGGSLWSMDTAAFSFYE